MIYIQIFLIQTVIALKIYELDYNISNPNRIC